MHLDQDRAVRTGAASYSAPLVCEQFADSAAAAAAVTVMIASNRNALRVAWFSMLACEPDIGIKGEPVMISTNLVACVEHFLPKVLLLDKALLDQLDPQSLRRIHAQRHRVRVLLWDETGHDLVANVLRNRFNGFVLTTNLPEVCLKAIRAVSKGELWLSRASLASALADLPGFSHPDDVGASTAAFCPEAARALTPRELQVVALLRRGCINKEIARELGIMEDTVKKHLQSVFAKMGVHRRALVAMRRLPA